ncbi:MAG: NADH-quinone oxidoreductase subunit H [Leptospiraceae bacterium]|nr:NADH-quinone oxidoreductase subunit H [Leptospiraceae bacterium]
MSAFEFDLMNMAIMVTVAWLTPLQFIPLMIWLERKGAAIIQDRIGPNRAAIFGVRLFGMLHNIADVIKLMMKEDITPNHVSRFYYLLAPFWAMTIALIPLMLIPFAASVPVGEFLFRFQATNFDNSLLLLFAVTGLGVYGIILAGWASNNKFSLLGGLRSSAQMISYELTMALAIVGILLVYNELRIEKIVEAQGRFIEFGNYYIALPAWGIFLQPIGFFLFLIAAFAETNRTPFDLAEGESELVAGYHIEYSSMKFALFFMAEYANMVVASLVVATLFLGGYQLPGLDTNALRSNPNQTAILALAMLALGMGIAGYATFKRIRKQKQLFASGGSRLEYPVLAIVFIGAALTALALIPIVPGIHFDADFANWMTMALQAGTLLGKALIFCWLFVQIRWTLPRFRYDQLMNLGWRMLMPLALLNIVITALVKFYF